MMKDQVYRFRVGEFECISLNDHGGLATAAQLFANCTAQERNTAIREHGYDPVAIPFPNTCLAVHTGDQWVLLDAGFGTSLRPESRLSANLEAVGLKPEDFSAVLISHLDPDHYGGLTDSNGNLLYTNAQIFIWEKAWRYWTSAEALGEYPSRASLIRTHLLPLESQAHFVQKEGELLPGFRMMAAPGHRPGHTVIRVESAGERLLVVGDAFISTLHITCPDWHFPGDHDPRRANATRWRLAQLAADSNAVMHGFHFPFPCVGYVRRQGDRLIWEPYQPPKGP